MKQSTAVAWERRRPAAGGLAGRARRTPETLPGAVAVIAMLAAGPLGAQEPTVRAYLDPAEVEVGERFRVIVEITGVEKVEDVFIPPVFPFSGPRDDRLLPFSTAITTPAAGQTGGTVTLEYSFRAKTAGTVEIGPVLVTADGHDLDTELLTLLVKDTETVTVEAWIEPAEVRVMEEFEVHVHYYGVETLLERPIIADLSAFARRSGSGRSGGSAHFEYVALKPGEYDIGPVSVKVGSNSYESEPLTLVVSDEPPALEATVLLGTGQPWVGGSFGLELEVLGASHLDTDPVLPDISGFAVVEPGYSGSSGGARTVNGVRSRFVTEGYRLRALSAGEFEIGPVRVTAAGHTAFSEPVRLTIADVAPEAAVPREDLRVTTSIAKQRVYVGEQAIVSYRLFSRGPVWSGEGSWRAEFDTVTMPSREDLRVRHLRWLGGGWERTLLDGRWYEPLGGASVAIYPLGPGEKTIGPAKLGVQINHEPRSLPGAGLPERMGTWAPMTLASDPVAIEVLPLPAENRPASFGGHVGILELVAWVNRTDAAVGDTIMLHVELAGNGHSRELPAPEIVVPAGFEVSDPEVSHFNDRRDGGGLHGTRAHIYRLVANREGGFRIPPVEVSWFDPESGSYRVSRAGPFDLTVASAGEEQEG